MAAKLVFPFIKSSHMAGMGHLHMDQHDIVGGIVVEPRHCAEIIHIFFAFKQFLDPLLNAGSDFLQPFLVALLLVCHTYNSFPDSKMGYGVPKKKRPGTERRFLYRGAAHVIFWSLRPCLGA